MKDPETAEMEEEQERLEHDIAAEDPDAPKDRSLGDHHFKEPEKEGPGVI